MTPSQMYNAYTVRHRKCHIFMHFFLFLNYRLLFMGARAQFGTRRDRERKYLYLFSWNNHRTFTKYIRNFSAYRVVFWIYKWNFVLFLNSYRNFRDDFWWHYVSLWHCHMSLIKIYSKLLVESRNRMKVSHFMHIITPLNGSYWVRQRILQSRCENAKSNRNTWLHQRENEIEREIFLLENGED